MAFCCVHVAGIWLQARFAPDVEPGVRDGTLLLRVARRGPGSGAQVTLLDRQDLVAAEIRGGFAALGWPVESRASDGKAVVPACTLAQPALCLSGFILDESLAREFQRFGGEIQVRGTMER